LPGVTFYSENGCLVLAGNDCKIYDLNDKLVREARGQGDDVLHFANFIEAIRTDQSLRAEIEEAQKSTRLCHLGNLAWRAGRSLQIDPKARMIVGDRKAAALASRAYRPGWEPRV
jgi:hypothetical protein